MDANFQIGRREMLLGAAAAAMVPGAAFGASGAAANAADKVKAAIDADRAAGLQRLVDWIAHPGIAAENWQMDSAVQFTMDAAAAAGFGQVAKVPTSGHPGVFGTIDAGARRTLGIYFMYDVKQVDEAKWSSPPFKATLADKPGWGKVLVGRGAVNQKGPEMAFLNALHAFRKAGVKLPVNLVLVAEGEEEMASPNFHEIVQTPKVLAALRRSDGIIIPSAAQSGNGNVSINLGAKGPLEFQLISSAEHWGRGPRGEIHSSMAAIVDAPAWRLVQALNVLIKPDGHTPAIDGWFDNVRPLTAREKELIAKAAANMSEADMKAAFGVTHWIDDWQWQQALEHLAADPTLNLQGLVGGYTGAGGKSILPGRAEAKLEARLVPNQTRKEAEEKLRAHLQKHGFGDIEVVVTGGYDPTETAEDARIIRAEQAVYGKYGIQTALNPRLAGSWPGSVFTQPPLAKPAGQFGIGYGSGAHAPNEFLVIDSTRKGIYGYADSSKAFVDYLYAMADLA